MNKKILAPLLLIIPLLIYTAIVVIDVYQLTAQAEETPTITVTVPLGRPDRPQRDGVVIAGRESVTVRIAITLPETATTNWTNIEVVGDGRGTSDQGIEFQPDTGSDPTADLTDLTGNVLDKINGEWQGDQAYFNLPKLEAGQTWNLYYRIIPPDTIPQEPSYIVLTIKIKLGEEYGWQEITKTIKIINPPITRLYVVIALTIGVFVALLFLSKTGFFEMYSTLDLVSMAMIGAAMVVWVQILGRQFVFPITDRIPFAYNFAIADIPYVLLLITAIILVKKPGVASLTLFVYNLVSEIGWYGINPLWWAYPFAQGLPVDLYLLLRGKAVFTDKALFFKRTISEEEFEKAFEIKGLKYMDGLIVGFLRGFFMQVSLYLVFFPNLFRLEYLWEYVFWWIVIPWSIGNAIGGAISVPIAERIREAAQY